MWAEDGIRVGKNEHRFHDYMEPECAEEPMREIEINLKSEAVPHVTLKDQVTSVDIL